MTELRYWLVGLILRGFPSGSVVKEPTCSAGDAGLIPGSGGSPGEGNGTHFSILVWKIPWTEEPGGLQSTGLQRFGHDLVTKQQQHIWDTSQAPHA